MRFVTTWASRESWPRRNNPRWRAFPAATGIESSIRAPLLRGESCDIDTTARKSAATSTGPASPRANSASRRDASEMSRDQPVEPAHVVLHDGDEPVARSVRT